MGIEEGKELEGWRIGMGWGRRNRGWRSEQTGKGCERTAGEKRQIRDWSPEGWETVIVREP